MKIRFSIILVMIFAAESVCRLSEQDRVQQWYSRNYTWPPTWQPESVAFSRAMEIQERYIHDNIFDDGDRWYHYLDYTAKRLVPRFTEVGFEIRDTPPGIQKLLRQEVVDALPRLENVRDEGEIDILYTPIPSKKLHVPHLHRDIYDALRPDLEEWVGGMALEESSIYGIRMNRNESTLGMHLDRIATHVVSAIVHVAHAYDNVEQPWPISIEDNDGNMHELFLEEGQMLFYESAACMHGRPTPFQGEFYASIFVHFRPIDQGIWNLTETDVELSVPPHWRDGVIYQHHPHSTTTTAGAGGSAEEEL
mmetsp:Transcript_17936/g.30173  ORF Transcript_17936/g.30173 Transcript_17936/m.30173 type:complete len:307 (-) Transcript_17936:31-951(-)